MYVLSPSVARCSKTFGTYLIQQHNRGKRLEAEQLVAAAAMLTEAAAAPKAEENNSQQQALVSICTAVCVSNCGPMPSHTHKAG